MRFSEFSQYLAKLEKTSSRNEITYILTDLFRKAKVNEIDKICYLSLGMLAPTFRGINFNIAEKLMLRAIALAYDEDLQTVTSLFKKRGDLGNVVVDLALAHKLKLKARNLSVEEVYERLFKLATDGGEGSQERKLTQIAELFKDLDVTSAKFVARIPVSNLRLGFSDMTILDALSFLIKKDKSARKQIEMAFNVSVDIGKIAKTVKRDGLKGLTRLDPEVGTPIRPSLAERLPSAEKILEKVPAEGSGRVAVEPKYDGFRAQIHLNKGVVSIFSRNLENTTKMFPDLVEAVKKLKVESAIFDSEAIVIDVKTGKFPPFQETAQRKRKYGIAEAMKNLPLKLFVFDILYKNGTSFMNMPFSQRRKILESTIPDNNDVIEVARQSIVDKADKIRDLIKEYLSEGLEGAMIKKIDAPYKAGGRGFHWVKYKKTTEEGVADTIDCLVMGVYKGQGKRTGFGAGAFLVGVLDPLTNSVFKTVSKIGTGLTDEQWREIKTRSTKLGIRNKPSEYEVHKNLEPDVWCRPSLVVEILADEITKSPIHTAGLALRFPRLIRFRDDKNPEQATSVKELEKLYKMQKIGG